MNGKTTTEEFIALVTTFKDAVLSWNENNSRLVLTTDSDIGELRYLAPNHLDMPLEQYTAFLEYLDNLCRFRTGDGLPHIPVISENESAKEETMDNIMTADKFLEVTRNSKSISVGKDSSSGLFIVVSYHTDEGEDDLVKTYQGPDPTTTVYGEYMRFLAELYSTPGLSNFVEIYQKNILRRMGRMTQ